MVGQTPLEHSLHRVSKASAQDLERLKEGVYHESSTSRSIDDLREQAVADRLRLGDSFLSAGSAFLRKRPAENRAAVGRFYYAMYHYMRAVVFFSTLGDDFQEHSKLPMHIPSDFPAVSSWANRLKDARLHRNEADYDAYPSADADFRLIAKNLEQYAQALTTDAYNYLRSKGCKYV